MKKQFLLFLVLLAAVAVASVSCRKYDLPIAPETSLTPSNCHIVSLPGSYSFQAVKGNSNESVGAVASVEVLWESFGTSEAPAKGDIVAEAGYSASDGLVHFKTSMVLKDGNALIAAKDASGNILWSWHIWVCGGWDPEKTAHTYYNGAGVMMDRNLGATSAIPGAVQSLGLLYQWGRKDPFLGSGSITDEVDAESTLSWPEPEYSTAQTGTIDYAIAHPTTFIVADEANYDWYHTGEYSTDNTRWGAEKTIYDPCPDGWTLPTGPTPTETGFWYTAFRHYLMSYYFDTSHRGHNFSGLFGDANPIWYPMAGFRADNSGYLSSVGRRSGFWTSTPDLDENDPQAKVMALGLDIATFNESEISVFTATDYCRAIGFTVRCVRE